MNIVKINDRRNLNANLDSVAPSVEVPFNNFKIGDE